MVLLCPSHSPWQLPWIKGQFPSLSGASPLPPAPAKVPNGDQSAPAAQRDACTCICEGSSLPVFLTQPEGCVLHPFSSQRKAEGFCWNFEKTKAQCRALQSVSSASNMLAETHI